MNSTAAVFVSLLLMVCSALGRWVNRDGSRPLFWHNSVWVLTLLLLGTNLIDYDESSTTAWLVLLAGLLAFNVGSLLAMSPAPDSIVNRGRKAFTIKPLVTRKLLLVTCLVYFASFGVYLYSISVNYGLQVLLTDPSSIRAISLDGESYLSKTPQIARLGLNLGPVLLVIFAVREAASDALNFAFRMVMVLVIAGTMLAMLQRTNLFMAILWYLAYVLSKQSVGERASGGKRGMPDNLSIKRTQSRRRGGLILAAIAGPLILLLAFQLLGSALGKTGQQALSTGRVSPTLAASGFSDAYVYATAGVPAFLKLVDSTNNQWPPDKVPGGQIVGDYNPQTYGAATFGPLAKLVPGAKAWNPIAPFMDIGILTNVFTWFELPYRDFRLGGVVAFGFIMGFVTTRGFIRRYESAGLYWMQAAFFSTLFLSTFVAKISTAIFWTGVLYVTAATIYTRRRQSTATAFGNSRPHI